MHGVAGGADLPAAVAPPAVADAVPAAAAAHAAAVEAAPIAPKPAAAGEAVTAWADDAQKELQKIPFFVRGKARRNTERFALERGVALITVETLYDAKAHFGR